MCRCLHTESASSTHRLSHIGWSGAFEDLMVMCLNLEEVVGSLVRLLF